MSFELHEFQEQALFKILRTNHCSCGKSYNTDLHSNRLITQTASLAKPSTSSLCIVKAVRGKVLHGRCRVERYQVYRIPHVIYTSRGSLQFLEILPFSFHLNVIRVYHSSTIQIKLFLPTLTTLLPHCCVKHDIYELHLDGDNRDGSTMPQ